MEINEILEERKKTHGNFLQQAHVARCLKVDMQNGKNWGVLPYYQKEALEMVAHKIARILSGNPNLLDSWKDAIGYLQLVVNELEDTEGAIYTEVIQKRLTNGEWKELQQSVECQF